jgi:hypothetical protein
MVMSLLSRPSTVMLFDLARCHRERDEVAAVDRQVLDLLLRHHGRDRGLRAVDERHVAHHVDGLGLRGDLQREGHRLGRAEIEHDVRVCLRFEAVHRGRDAVGADGQRGNEEAAFFVGQC